MKLNTHIKYIYIYKVLNVNINTNVHCITHIYLLTPLLNIMYIHYH
jgi:hypothetical protein